jgi:hypothetical protein
MAAQWREGGMSDTAEILDEAASKLALHDDVLSEKEKKQKAGHYEVLGETLAKFEFFQNGWDPYTHFLDVDKVDLALRRRRGNLVEYRDVQVKYGKLYENMSKFEHKLFCTTSWRFFTVKELEDLEYRKGLYLAYVLSRDDRYRGDIFIFPINEFVAAVKQAVKAGDDRYKVYISKGHSGDKDWYVRRQGRKFEKLDETSVLDVSKHYRNFACLG